jgi:hypothetical protein
MTIFTYAILQAARQRMTPDEAEVAAELARLADHGNRDAADALGDMVCDVLRVRSLPSLREETAAVDAVAAP